MSKIEIPPRIHAGLNRIPRQVGTFAEFRAAMLAEIEEKDALASWRARGKSDPGVMLLEMWAYICDVLSFYDETIAHEAYLRTARRRDSLRKLAELVGYLPKPAVAALAELAVKVDGYETKIIPIGTAFRSAGFNGNPPQIFETTQVQSADPAKNEFELEPLPDDVLTRGHLSTLHIPVAASVKTDAEYCIVAEKEILPKIIFQSVGPSEDYRGRPVKRLEISAKESGSRYISNTVQHPLKIYRKTSLGTQVRPSCDEPSGSSHRIYDLKYDKLECKVELGDRILLEAHSQVAIGRVTKLMEIDIRDDVTIGYPSGDGHVNLKVKVPKLVHYVRIKTVKSFDVNVKRASLLTPAAETIGLRPACQELRGEWDITKRPDHPTSNIPTQEFAFEDRYGNHYMGKGPVSDHMEVLDVRQSGLTLEAPIKAFGNLITATRGETMKDEILGSGDASQASQKFTLKKGPLTYLPGVSTTNPHGIESTLEIRVDGIVWSEVRYFHGVEATDRVYIVRHDDEGGTTITFGDGICGSRLPTGKGNVVANYRFGAGEAAPPENGIKQMMKPVKGVKALFNPSCAYGGSDAETGEALRENAAAPAMLMERAVSIRDLEALARTCLDVRAVKAVWEWDEGQQQAVVKIRYISSENSAMTLEEHLAARCYPLAPISAEEATPVYPTLSITVDTDPAYVNYKVASDVRERLLDEKNGILIPENLGIGGTLYRSKLFEEVLAVEGVQGVDAIAWGDVDFIDYRQPAGVNEYFDFAPQLRINYVGEPPKGMDGASAKGGK